MGQKSLTRRTRRFGSISSCSWKLQCRKVERHGNVPKGHSSINVCCVLTRAAGMLSTIISNNLFLAEDGYAVTRCSIDDSSDFARTKRALKAGQHSWRAWMPDSSGIGRCIVRHQYYGSSIYLHMNLAAQSTVDLHIHVWRSLPACHRCVVVIVNIKHIIHFSRW